MKGFVLTPSKTVDSMVGLLFSQRAPSSENTVLDPGCGTGEFIDGIVRWCQRNGLRIPRITGVELDPSHLPVLREKYRRFRSIHIEHSDFLEDRRSRFDYIIGNPPYVPITGLSEDEKIRYRGRFDTARGRFDLYLLFFEQALRLLKPAGRLVFITPEKYLYVDTAGPLRNLLSHLHVEEIRLVHEDTFGQLVTYPTITTVNNTPPKGTRVVHRDGSKTRVVLSTGTNSWLPVMQGQVTADGARKLGELCLRLSCGIATGADEVFVRSASDIDPALKPFAYPTIAGRELTPTTNALKPRFAMLVPYEPSGKLIALDELGPLKLHLLRDDVRKRLLARTCVKRKPWYAFHETPRLMDILRPKIVFKDIGERPQFWIDRSGEILPRHSVYYIVPHDPSMLDEIASYLRSPSAHKWLSRNCQRASKGFLRLQSRVLRRMPIPDDLGRSR